MCFALKRPDFTHKLTQWRLGRLSFSPPFRIPASLPPRIVREAPLYSFTAASFSTIPGGFFRRRVLAFHYPSPGHPYGEARMHSSLGRHRDELVTSLEGHPGAGCPSLSSSRAALFTHLFCIVLHDVYCWLHFIMVNIELLLVVYAFVVLLPYLRAQEVLHAKKVIEWVLLPWIPAGILKIIVSRWLPAT